MSPNNLVPGSESNFRKDRIKELDVLRGLAFLAVVLQHTLGVYVRKADIQIADAAMLGMLFNFTKFAVPAFVFATGTVLFYNYYEKLEYRKFIWKRTVEIFLPYLLWTGIYEIYYYGLPLINFSWLREFGKNVILGTESYHLWFIILIFQFYLIYPVFLALFKWVRVRITTKTRFTFTLGALIVIYTLLMWFSSSYIPRENLQVNYRFLQLFFLDYRDRNFLYFSFYFILGGIAGLSISKWREFVLKSVIWNGFLFPALFIWIGYELMRGASGGQVNLNYSTTLKPSMFFYTVSEIILLYGLCITIVRSGSVIIKRLSFIGKFSYGAYLAHALVLGYVVRGINRFMPSEHYLWSSTIAFILCAMVSVGITVLISKIPFGRLLIGPYRR